MEDILRSLLPNTMDKLPELAECMGQTLYMVGLSGAISFVFGLLFGVALIVTRRGGILQNAVVYNLLDKITNTFRAIPFVILIFALLPVTRAIVGTAIGTNGAILPLVVGTVPFFSRQIESALSDVDGGLIEAAQSMGTGPVGLIFRVYLRESIPGIVRATSITFVSLISFTTLAGSIGGGGLGDFAIRYGYQRRMYDITCVTILILLVIITLIQAIAKHVIKRTSH